MFGIKRGVDKDTRSPSPKTEEDMDDKTEKYCADTQATSACIKHPREQQK